MEKIFCIALNTFRESVRSKVLYSVMFFAAAVVLISSFFGRVTIGDQVKVIKDFGLFSISLFSVAFAVISGAALLHKELSKKTVYNILAKSVERWEFLLGKFLGMMATVTLMVLLMASSLIAFVYLFTFELDVPIFHAIPYMLLELMIVCAAAIFFSSIVVTPMLSGMFTFALFLAGRSTEYLLYFVNDAGATPATKIFGRTLYAILPHLSDLTVSDYIVYADLAGLSATRFLWSALYTVGYSGALLVVATIIFRRRQFN